MTGDACEGPADARTHRVDGVSNFRDFGGYALARGGALARGRCFRSAHLAGLTAAGEHILDELAIATVIDLRGAHERTRAPASLSGSSAIAVVTAPIEPRVTRHVRGELAAGTLTPSGMRALMIETYRGFVRDHASEFGVALAAMAAASGRPLLIHCTAGKDRTGFLVALVHALLGVERDTVLADYAATNSAWDRASVGDLLAFDPATVEPLLAADPDYLDAAFAEIARIDGSPAAFLARATAGRVAPAAFDTWTSET